MASGSSYVSLKRLWLTCATVLVYCKKQENVRGTNLKISRVANHVVTNLSVFVMFVG